MSLPLRLTLLVLTILATFAQWKARVEYLRAEDETGRPPVAATPSPTPPPPLASWQSARRLANRPPGPVNHGKLVLDQ